ncbi:MAG: hypothetical protein U5L09_05875 [Bacteroidales bacterium]|nr:hypothetical protein [Bacteroidales bacterium]
MVRKVEKDKPFVFLYGSGHMLLSSDLEGLQPDEPFEFSITSDEAYGDVQIRMPW